MKTGINKFLIIRRGGMRKQALNPGYSLSFKSRTALIIIMVV
jgi:hypothetical protein